MESPKLNCLLLGAGGTFDYKISCKAKVTARLINREGMKNQDMKKWGGRRRRLGFVKKITFLVSCAALWCLLHYCRKVNARF